ncbi:MFS transporter [Streptomyces sp. ITFR-16]|uniref:MFS transporter n=1 Tax=Streptomyces sp. ITFR-16 TaxID=3075198 RepID=UPI00288B69EE|nr:MFS transporter [Streptomyces sp. ITFR-16]WNI21517.1 MFS transporter [Streptomyces sp. ITFR-16]
MGALRQLLLQHRDYRLVLSAGLISLTGDWILRTGLAYQVFALTGSTLASGGMLLASFLPQVLLGSLAGALVDRWDRLRTMIAANVLLAAGLLPLLLVDGPGRIWIVYTVMFWEGTVQIFFEPAEKALVPLLVDPRQLITANALNAQNADVARLIGGAVGGATAAWGGIGAVTLVNVATFALSAFLLTRVAARHDKQARPSAAVPRRTVTGPVRRLRALGSAALGPTWHHRPLRVVLGFIVITGIGQGIMSTLFAPFVVDVLHGSGAAYGTVVSAQAVGGIAGGLATAVIGGRFRAVRLWICGALLTGAIDLVIFCYPLVLDGAGVGPAIVCVVLVGLPASLMFTGLMTAIQDATDDAVRGRVFGVLGAAEAASMLAGIAIGATCAGTLGIIPLLTAQGFGLIAGGCLALAGTRWAAGPPAASPDHPGPAPDPADAAPAQRAVPDSPEPADRPA